MRAPVGENALKGYLVISALICHGSITQVHCELHSAPVQLQTEGVSWLLRGGGHQQPKGPLGHEAEGHILSLCVCRPWQDHLHVHAAVVAHHGGLYGFQEEEELADTKPDGES